MRGITARWHFTGRHCIVENFCKPFELQVKEFPLMPVVAEFLRTYPDIRMRVQLASHDCVAYEGVVIPQGLTGTNWEFGSGGNSRDCPDPLPARRELARGGG